MIGVLFLPSFLIGQNNLKQATALRISEKIKIDGILSEESWKNAEFYNDFRQYDPVFDLPPSQQTEVRILYSDNALYISAFLFDTAPDSLLKQLGNRDDNLNADAFGFMIDTYNNQNDFYTFEVSVSGVQKDSRDLDARFNAVWESAVSINDSGWIAEIRIPYSAIRFPRKNTQLWRIQFYRNLRRKREWSQWALETKGDAIKSSYWGELHGIENINPPLRLSLTPYMTFNAEHYPYNIPDKKNSSTSFSGGMDLKWGLDESHTLDLTLLPDFSQVQSDNQIKNLTAFETVYDEKRTFFQESIDLFNKGSLFYSRRIGRIPLNYDLVSSQLDSNEYIINNPYQAKLINAMKISGRNKKGFAIGFFNAITDNTFAIIGDSSKGERKILTDPLTNYNILVLDKAFKKNSSAYLINTNVIRDGSYRDANVTGGGINLLNRNNYYRINLTGAYSRIFNSSADKVIEGYKYYALIGKVKGNFLINISRSLVDDGFDNNDLGLMNNNSQVDNVLTMNYNIYEPFSKFLYLKNSLVLRNDYHFNTKKITFRGLTLTSNTTLNNYLTIWGNINTDFCKRHDFYEARSPGRFYLRPINTGGSINFSSDYRKTLALDGSMSLIWRPETEGFYQAYKLMPIVRLNNRFSFNYSFFISNNKNDIGYAGNDNSNNIYFGRRQLQNIENTFSGLYVVKNDVSFSCRIRHYWITGRYSDFYRLENSGLLSSSDDFNTNKDFNFNSFNVDVLFNWQFAPGSQLNLIWKNALLEENNLITYNYFDNFTQTLGYPQLNTLTLKIIYYIDYQNVRERLNTKRV